MPYTRSILIFLASALVAYVQGQCTTQVPINTGHYCFKYIKELMTYSQAVKRCASLGAVVGHPAAQDFKQWTEDVRAVTRNEESLWVGTERNGSTWNWLMSKYDGSPVAIDFDGKHKGDISIPESAWGVGSDHKCVMNDTTPVNETMTNSTKTAKPKYCEDSEKNCAYLSKNGKLISVACESFEQFYVVCQGAKDYSSACMEEQNCSENAYHYPISFNLCGCKCPSDYIGDGYNECNPPYDGIGIFTIIVIVIIGLIIVLTCAAGVRRTKEGKNLEGDALRKIWTPPCVCFFIGIFIILWVADII